MNIFIAEDKPYMNKSWALKFRNAGHIVVSAYSLEQALELCTTKDFGIFLVDACLDSATDPNYQALLDKIFSLSESPVISVSGDAQYRQDMLDAGCKYAVPKEETVKKTFEVIGELETKLKTAA